MRLELVLALITLTYPLSALAQDPAQVSIRCRSEDEQFSFDCAMNGTIRIQLANRSKTIDSKDITPRTQSACAFEFEKPQLVGAHLRSDQYLLKLFTTVSESYSHYDPNAQWYPSHKKPETPRKRFEVISQYAVIDGSAPLAINLSFDWERDCSIEVRSK